MQREWVRQRTDDGEAVRDLRDLRQMLPDVDSRHVGGNRPEFSLHLARGERLGIKRLVLRR
jgi:hypothetical protein